VRRLLTSASALLAVAALLLAGCGDDGGAATTTTTSPAAEPAPDEAGAGEAPADDGAEPAEVLRILLANDDGIAHPGLDLMLRELVALDGVEVTVVAPAENMSGSSDQTTEGGAPHAPGATASGVEGTAVDGFPADAVHVALDELGLDPHLVVSGINDAQNHGPFVTISGTVGVARTAIRRDIPAIAISAGLEYDDAEFGVAAALVVDWVLEHRDALVTGTQTTDHAVSINVPTCPVEAMGELVEVPVAEDFLDGIGPYEFACDLGEDDPVHDHAALHAGYPTLTRVPADLE
jgi:5'-nucleotidase